MKSYRIAHIGDIHYSGTYLAEVGECMAYVRARLAADPPDLIVIPGDTFDHRLEQNSPAFLAALDCIRDLADIAHLLILQGTFSHDAPRAIDVFRYVESIHPVFVADRIQQVFFGSAGFRVEGFDEWLDGGAGVLLSCLPAINKGQAAAIAGAERAGEAAGEAIGALLRGWSKSHLAARAAGAPSVILSHGTVSGSMTEHGCVMAGLDHEFTAGQLFAAEASAVMLNHIHKHQSWERDGRRIAYAGSIGRLHFGEIDPKGFLMWDVSADHSSFEFIETPARKLLDIEFPGSPVMDELARYADQIRGEQNIRVRLRWAVDEEHRHSVDREAIERLFEGHDLKIEARIIPVTRQRAAGISQALTNADRLRQWCELTDTPADPLLERLALLEGHDESLTKEDQAA